MMPPKAPSLGPTAIRPNAANRVVKIPTGISDAMTIIGAIVFVLAGLMMALYSYGQYHNDNAYGATANAVSPFPAFAWVFVGCFVMLMSSLRRLRLTIIAVHNDKAS